MQCKNYLEAILLFAKEKQRKHSSDPLTRTNVFTQNIFVCCPLCPCFRLWILLSVSGGNFIYMQKVMELGVLVRNGKEKSLFTGGTLKFGLSESSNCCEKASCCSLPCPFYLNILALQPSTTFCHLFQHPRPLEMWISPLFFLTTVYQMISPCAIHLDPYLLWQHLLFRELNFKALQLSTSKHFSNIN